MTSKVLFDNGLEIDFAPKFNAKTRRMLARSLKEAREGKGLSPAFTNAKDAIAYLKNITSKNARRTKP